MDRFHLMTVFAAVAEEQGFAGGARRLGLSPPAVTRAIATLERRLGVKLLNRTTRFVRVTDAGARYLESTRRILAEADEADEAAAGVHALPRGQLAVTAPVLFGSMFVMPGIVDFLNRYPEVSVSALFVDRIVNLLEEGLDVGVRIGELPDSTMRAIPVGYVRRVVCASPRYLELRGTPRHPRELAGHSVISYTYWSTRDEWHFDGPEGRVGVRTRPRLHTNSGDTCRAAALAHQGVILQPTFLVGEDLAAGTLLELMPQYRSIELGIYAVYPTRKHLSPKVRALIEFLAQRLGEDRVVR